MVWAYSADSLHDLIGELELHWSDESYATWTVCYPSDIEWPCLQTK
jgi:hypothetical protein